MGLETKRVDRLANISGEAEWRLTGRKSGQLKKLQELEAPTLAIRYSHYL
jgi:hypothetical protein